ncbi:hypothetical protein V8C86DRAFT_2629312 [Haematococcus lacustris]
MVALRAVEQHLLLLQVCWLQVQGQRAKVGVRAGTSDPTSACAAAGSEERPCSGWAERWTAGCCTTEPGPAGSHPGSSSPP